VAAIDSEFERQLVEHFYSTFWGRVSPALRRLSWVGTLAAVIIGSLIARNGMVVARLSALGLAFSTMAWFLAMHLRRQRQKNDVVRVLTQVVRPGDLAAGDRSLRAVRLLRRSLQDVHSGSVALAEHHLQQSLNKVSAQAIVERARRRAWWMDGLTLVALMTLSIIMARAGHRVLEGLDVALARGGRAPVPMFWLDVNGVIAQPPAYLRVSEHPVVFGSRMSEPKGTVISVRGTPVRSGVTMLLSDGSRAVEFVETTDGEVVAHWTLERSGQLKVAVRFGQVLVEQFDSIMLDALDDDPPRVVLDQAGQTVRMDRTSRVELNYRASDDYGLRQIDLVLKSPDREERRTLMRLDGQQREQQGAHSLSVDDAFLKHTHLPTRLRIEARDDNNLGQDNWGHSDWIILEPPMPGQPQADRIEVLHRIRARLVDWLAVELTSKLQSNGDSETLSSLRQLALDELAHGLNSRAESWRWPTSVEILLRTVNEKLSRMRGSRAVRLTILERATLALDSAAMALSQRDARAVAGIFAELADEVARGARQATSTEFQAAGTRTVNDALTLLDGGTKPLAALGTLGADLSSIVRATLSRLQRARNARDFIHVQLGAEHLAARLRRPELSAGNRDTSGVESAEGASRRTRGARPPASNAALRIERLLMELQQLKQEHRSSLELLERALKGAQAEAALDEPRAENREQANRLRRVAEGLPTMGAEPDSALSSQVVAREQALGAAESMLHFQNREALERVRVSREAITEALLRDKREGKTENVDEKSLRRLDEELVSQARYLEQDLERTRQKVGHAAASQLRDQVVNERQLANRARTLANRERRDDSVIPEILRDDLVHAGDFMDLASDALERSNGPVALDHEQRAQSLLDHFDTQSRDGSRDEWRDDQQGQSGSASNQGTVTPTGDPESAARFRSRVQKGLSSKASGELGSTIRRYAEGLLR
jgi:hypothetical protein